MNLKKQINLYILATLLLAPNHLFSSSEDPKPVSQFGNSILCAGSALSAGYFSYRIFQTVLEDYNKLTQRDPLFKMGAWALAINALVNTAYNASLRTPAKSTVLRLSNATKVQLKRISSYFYCN